jgi:hypothetical protein
MLSELKNFPLRALTVWVKSLHARLRLNTVNSPHRPRPKGIIPKTAVDRLLPLATPYER